jgi:hypothetical protein
MQREIFAYIDYLNSFKEFKKPKMPKFDITAYTDIEYQKAILEIDDEFNGVNDIEVYLKFLKGE